MDRLERENLREISMLNQRGGRSLSVVDLMAAGTMSAEMAALCWVLVEDGASFLTGAVPGGAGKTTLMAGLLAFLPAGERIVTAADPIAVERAATGEINAPFCLLAHEIGQGAWYGYIWGGVAQKFFSLRGPDRRRVSCLHADTPAQCHGILSRCGVAPKDADRIGMMLFIRVIGGYRPLRRVGALHWRDGGHLRPLYRWDEGRDRFEALLTRPEIAARVARSSGSSPGGVLGRWDRYADCLTDLERDGVREFEAVRSGVVRCAGD